MGAKQSKRSVDISGKEAEGGGEVAAAGAGGEGRVEQIADVDALKPQINGDAHIQQEQTDKEKELDSGTPENEKDATTEKEDKESEKEKEAAPVTNGDAEEKIENGVDTTPPAEDGKKPKKEKVKKKWSLRSISFSRKDKPKQEKKQKEEEPKTNGEPEKVPEEAAEANAESAANEVAEEAKAVPATKEETSPETPVTEPLTNGSSTPEEVAPALSPALDAPVPEVKPVPEPEQLPINGLSLQETKPEPETAEPEKTDDPKPEALVAEIVETAPAPEIPVKEVCVEQMPLLESTPPPLPANPPPSSVASFAATTMAPELTDASLPNTADAADTADTAETTTPPTLPHPDTTPLVTDTLLQNDVSSELKTTEVEAKVIEPVSTPAAPVPVDVEPLKEANEVKPTESETVCENGHEEIVIGIADIKPEPVETITESVAIVPEPIKSLPEPQVIVTQESIESEPEKDIPEPEVKAMPVPEPLDVVEANQDPETNATSLETIEQPVETVTIEVVDSPPPEAESPTTTESPLPPPPPMQDVEEITESLTLDDIKPIPEDVQPEIEHFKTHASNIVNGVNGLSPEHHSNGDVELNSEDRQQAAKGASDAAAAELPHTQDVVTVSDKLADLIPEVPDMSELKSETLLETVSDVAVAN